MKTKYLLCALLFMAPLTHAQQLQQQNQQEEPPQELPWLILGGGEAEHVDSEVTTDFMKFGFGIPAYDGRPMAVEVGYWHFDENIGLSERQVLSLELMPRVDLGQLRLFVRGGPAFTTSGAGWAYGGGLEFTLFRASNYRWKLRLDWERFSDSGDLTENGPVDAATANLIVAH